MNVLYVVNDAVILETDLRKFPASSALHPTAFHSRALPRCGRVMVARSNTYVGLLVELRSRFYTNLMLRFCLLIPHAFCCASVVIAQDTPTLSRIDNLAWRIFAGVLLLVDIIAMSVLLVPWFKHPRLAPLLPQAW